LLLLLLLLIYYYYYYYYYFIIIIIITIQLLNLPVTWVVYVRVYIYRTGYGNTELDDENAFDQTVNARAELVQNFLSAIKVNRYLNVISVLQFPLQST